MQIRSQRLTISIYQWGYIIFYGFFMHLATSRLLDTFIQKISLNSKISCCFQIYIGTESRYLSSVLSKCHLIYYHFILGLDDLGFKLTVDALCMDEAILFEELLLLFFKLFIYFRQTPIGLTQLLFSGWGNVAMTFYWIYNWIRYSLIIE